MQLKDGKLQWTLVCHSTRWINSYRVITITELRYFSVQIISTVRGEQNGIREFVHISQNFVSFQRGSPVLRNKFAHMINAKNVWVPWMWNSD